MNKKIGVFLSLILCECICCISCVNSKMMAIAAESNEETYSKQEQVIDKKKYVDLSAAEIEKGFVDLANGKRILYDRYFLPQTNGRVNVYDAQKNLIQIRNTNYAEMIRNSLEVDKPIGKEEAFAEITNEISQDICNFEEFEVAQDYEYTLNYDVSSYVWIMERPISDGVKDSIFLESTLDGELALMTVSYAGLENLSEEQINDGYRQLTEYIQESANQDEYVIDEYSAVNYDGQIVIEYRLTFTIPGINESSGNKAITYPMKFSFLVD